MRYEPNTTQWKRGDIVIHDADRKHPDMLMSVVGYTRDGLVKTVYISLKHRRTIWRNEPCYLHDPARFGIEGK